MRGCGSATGGSRCASWARTQAGRSRSPGPIRTACGRHTPCGSRTPARRAGNEAAPWALVDRERDAARGQSTRIAVRDGEAQLVLAGLEALELDPGRVGQRRAVRVTEGH